MTIRFNASQVFVDCYHAMNGTVAVGMVIKRGDGRWGATVYRNVPPADLTASFIERSEAEAFVRDNMAMPVKD